MTGAVQLASRIFIAGSETFSAIVVKAYESGNYAGASRTANVSCTDAQGGLGQLRTNVSRSIRRMWKTSGLFDPSKVSTSSASGWLFLPPPQAALKRSRGYVIAKDDLRIIGVAAQSDQARLLDLFAGIMSFIVHKSSRISVPKLSPAV